VAGIVALTAPEAKIMPIRILDKQGVGELWRIKDAIIFAANNGANIVNISFGYDDKPELLKELLHNCDDSVVPPPGTQTFPELLNNIAVMSGAGNGGNYLPIFPAGNRIDAQLGVGASTRFDKLASFSTMSPERDIPLPGDEEIEGRSIRAVAPGRYGIWSGTSMAAPIASGLAALVKALNPTLTPHLIGERLEDTGFEWECFHPVRNHNIKTSRLDAYCAVTNTQPCGTNPFACTQSAQRSSAMPSNESAFEQFLKN
jgi:thermitase